MVALMKRTETKPKYICGGTLVGMKKVLTGKSYK
jgi:hypothetical protein